jgi:trimethylamine monooxygenase
MLSENNVRQYIQFNQIIKWIYFSEEKNEFSILIKDLIKDETRSEQFDYVIIATGHFSTPFIPYFEGIERFPGRLLHSHEFRCAQEFIKKNVLIIGNESSGEDIALQLYKYGSKSLTISYRTK